jgi:4-amino-4-deoxy-L-arabinose transferase-like glycosyltransferase
MITRHKSPSPWPARLGWLLGGSLLLRLVVAAGMHFGIDEAYAVAVSHPVSAGYLDHPPAVFWLAALGEWVSGERTPLVMRLPFVLLFAATTWLVARIGDHLFGEPAGFWSALTLNAAGMVGVTGGSWVLPDGPLFAGSALCAWGSARACVPRDSDGSGLRWWFVAGLGAAVAALSKYHAIFLPVGLLGFLLTTPGARRHLATPGPWVAALVALVGAAPAVWWNAGHDWASFRFQGARALPTAGWSPAPLLEAVGGQLGYLLPWVAPVIAWGVWRTMRDAPSAGHRLLVWMGGLPVVVFTGVALGGRRVLPHWTALGYLLLAPLVGAQLARAQRHGARWPIRWGAGSLTATALLALLLVSAVRTGWATNRQHPDPTAEALGWDEVADSLVAMRIGAGRPLAFVATAHWMQGGKLGAALGDALPLVVVADDRRHFRYRPAPVVTPTDTGALVRLAPREGAPLEPWLLVQFAAVHRLRDLAITRQGVPVATVERYLVTGWTPPSGAAPGRPR